MDKKRILSALFGFIMATVAAIIGLLLEYKII